MRQVSTILIILLALLSQILLAQDDTIKLKKKKWPFSIMQKMQEGNVSFVPIPAFSISPEKGVSVGIVVNYFFNSGISADEKQQTRLSNAYTNFQYSVLNQLVLEGVYSIYT
ncbi:MAG: hypothetical protein H7101_02700, partial [Deinococcales bacterium]|nr:hypothetical protein [Chitinophagaceae bacterium]